MDRLTTQDASARMRRSPAQARLAAIVAAAGAIGLVGCEQHPYPTPAPEETSSAPTPPSRLMGAPDANGASGPANDGAASDGHAPYGSGPYAQAQPYPGPSGAAPPSYGPPDQPARPPCPPDPTFKGPNAPSAIFCNAPIPNPPEDEPATSGRHHLHRHHRRHHLRAGAAFHGHHHHWTHVHHHRHHVAPVSAPTAAPTSSTVPATHRHTHSAPATQPVRQHRHGLTTAPSHTTVAPIPAVPVPAVPVHPAPLHHRRGRAAAVAASAPVAASEAAQYSALQSALTGEVARQATLNAPSHFTANQADDVTLTLPASFAQTVQTDATAQRLQAQTATANISATLAGEGFAVTPQDAQSQPIVIGQPITFHWKVTPQANAKGPLQAEISADLPSQGHSLPLGEVKSLSGVAVVTGRAVGVGILVVIALLGLGWVASRRRPKPSGAMRPRENHLTGI